MKQNTLTEIIADQTKRALWEVKNVIDCVYRTAYGIKNTVICRFVETYISYVTFT